MKNVNLGLVIIVILPIFSIEAKTFTPLEIDNHPCTPENLKVLQGVQH